MTSTKTYEGRLARKNSAWARPGHFDKGIPQGILARERSVETLCTLAESNGGWEKWPAILRDMGYSSLMSPGFPGFQCAEEYLSQGDMTLLSYPFFVGWMRAKGFVLESGQGSEWVKFQEYILAYTAEEGSEAPEGWRVITV